MGTKPYEIVVGAPFQVYLADYGEAFVDASVDPTTGNWELLGANGAENMDDEGVTVEHQQDVTLITPYGTTAPVKAIRTSESLMISFTLWDLQAAEYARVLNDNTVTAVAAGAGTAGVDEVPLYKGFEVSEKALLVRGEDASPAGDGWAVQYQVPRVVQTAAPSVAFLKGEPAGLQFELTALFDTAASAGEELGKLIIQTADPA